MADMQQDDTQTTTAVEAAADRALWKAVERGDVEVRDSDGDLILTAFNDKTRVAGRYLNNSGDEYWFMYEPEAKFTVRRVQPAQATPAGDGVQARETPRLMSSEERGEMMHNANAAAWRDGLNKLGFEVGATYGDKISDTPDKAIKLIRELRAQLAAANARAEKAEAEIEDMRHESNARANILNRAVTAKEKLYPGEIENGWISSIDRLARGAADAKRYRETLSTFLDSVENFVDITETAAVDDSADVWGSKRNTRYEDMRASAEIARQALTADTPDADTEADDAVAEDSAQRSV